jgi:Tol biopolymer transport system component
VRLRYVRAVRMGILLALAACGPSSAADKDAHGDAPGCAGMDFVLGERLDGVVAGGHDPSATGSALELWFSRTGIVPTYDLAAATRGSETATFDTQVDFAQNSSAVDRDPALTADGLDLVFISDRDGTLAAYEARRASKTDAFSPATKFPITGVDHGVELSADGLTLYYADDRRDLRAVHRSDRNSPFGGASEILAQNIEQPTVTADELELYYSRSDSLQTFRRTRRNAMAPFDDNEKMVFADAVEADVTPDGQRLYVVLNGNVWFLSRSCN